VHIDDVLVVDEPVRARDEGVFEGVHLLPPDVGLGHALDGDLHVKGREFLPRARVVLAALGVLSAIDVFR